MVVSVTLIEDRAVYDEDRYEIMCKGCGETAFITDRRYPKESRIHYIKNGTFVERKDDEFEI